ncbi:MAG TPA: hypothetical protein V6D34_10155 [Candidatus Sericytochromatia bacterium]
MWLALDVKTQKLIGSPAETVRNRSEGVMAIVATRLAAVCALLYRLRGSVGARATASTASGFAAVNHRSRHLVRWLEMKNHH